MFSRPRFSGFYFLSLSQAEEHYAVVSYVKQCVGE